MAQGKLDAIQPGNTDIDNNPTEINEPITAPSAATIYDPATMLYKKTQKQFTTLFDAHVSGALGMDPEEPIVRLRVFDSKQWYLASCTPVYV
jgi:hypothetical protein